MAKGSVTTSNNIGEREHPSYTVSDLDKCRNVVGKVRSEASGALYPTLSKAISVVSETKTSGAGEDKGWEGILN